MIAYKRNSNTAIKYSNSVVYFIVLYALYATVVAFYV